MSEDMEYWEWHPDYIGLYQVSNLGKVCRHYKNGNVCFLKFKTDKYGYYEVSLSKQNVRKTYTVHRLVLETFVGTCPQGMQACHNNGLRIDNRLENLRWDTVENNHADKKLHGTDFSGERNPNTRLTSIEVLNIVEYARVNSDKTYPEIARVFNVPTRVVQKIMGGFSWSTITGITKENREVRLVRNIYSEDEKIQIAKRHVVYGEKQNALAKEFGVSKQYVCNIVKKYKGKFVEGHYHEN